MTGSALIDFFITLIVLGGTGAMFFLTIDRLAPDELMAKIAKIAVGVVLAVVALLAVKGVLFGGGGAAISAGGIIGFAIGVIVILVVLFLIDKLLEWLGSQINANIVTIVKYVVFALALIALLVLADRTLFGGRYVGGVGPRSSIETPPAYRPELDATPRIIRPTYYPGPRM